MAVFFFVPPYSFPAFLPIINVRLHLAGARFSK